MLFRRDLPCGKRFALVDGRQDGAVLRRVRFRLVGGRVAPFLIDRPIAVKDNDAAAGPKRDALRAVGDVDACLVEFGRLHLACNRALPDQVVEPRLVIIQKVPDGIGRTGYLRRADRFVRFLRIRRRRAIGAGGVGKISVAEALADFLANRSDGFLAKLHAVGTHVCDQAGGLAADIDAFIKALRNLHCPACRETELSGRFLLSVEVVKGGFGFRSRIRFVWMSDTCSPSASIAAAAAMASVSVPMSSLPSFLPSRCVRRALKLRPSAFPSSVSTVQYS